MGGELNLVYSNKNCLCFINILIWQEFWVNNPLAELKNPAPLKVFHGFKVSDETSDSRPFDVLVIGWRKDGSMCACTETRSAHFEKEQPRKISFNSIRDDRSVHIIVYKKDAGSPFHDIYHISPGYKEGKFVVDDTMLRMKIASVKTLPSSTLGVYWLHLFPALSQSW